MTKLKNHSAAYWLNPAAAAAFDRMEDAEGFIDLNSAGRTKAEQQGLINRWNQGGKANRPPYLYQPASPAETSRHVMNGGIAFDTSEWRRVKAFCGKYGFKWWGDSDPVHFEYVGAPSSGGSNNNVSLHTGDIRKKQRQLNFLNFPVGDEDGKPGNLFVAGTKNYQNFAGLEPDGWNGNNTGNSLDAQVKWVQSRLIAWGFPVGSHGADGDPGDDTKNATFAFQKATGLTPDKIAGTDTRNKLAQNPPSKSNIPVGRNATSRPTREIQTYLIGQGYDLGKWGADNEWGQATGTAVWNWQGKNGLEQDSVWGPASDSKAFGTSTPPVVTPPVTTNPNPPFVLPTEIVRYSAWSTNTPKGDKDKNGVVQPIVYVPKASRKNLAVHWDGGDTPTTSAQALQMLKNYEAYHMRTAGAGMLKYNFAINPVDGTIYEGRGFDMRAMAIGEGNTPNISVIVVGGKGNLTLNARNSLRFIYKLTNAYLGFIAGQKVHSDFNPTECPGAEIRAWVHGLGMASLPESVTPPVTPSEPEPEQPTTPTNPEGTSVVKNSVLEAYNKELDEIIKSATALKIVTENILKGDK